MRLPDVIAFLLTLISLSLLSGCGGSRSTGIGGSGNGSPGPALHPPGDTSINTPPTVASRVKVLTSIAVFEDFVREVGQDNVEVRSIVPSGTDPHSFQPSPQDVREIANARVVIMNGAGLEGQLESLIRASVGSDALLVVLSEGLPSLPSDQTEKNGQTEGNPHFWLDVRYAIIYVNRIENSLSEADPARKELYRANASRYMERLKALDAWILEQIATIPEPNRKLVTFHDAFPYYANRYGLKLVGVVIRSPGSEPSAKEMAELINKIKSENVRTIFTEPQFNPAVIEVIGQEAGVSIAILYSDTVGEGITTYESLMRFDTDQIVNGLR